MTRHRFEWEQYDRSHRVVEIGGRTIHLAVNRLDLDDQFNGETVLLVPGLASGTSIFGPLTAELNNMGYQTIAMAHDQIDDDCSEDIRAIVGKLASGALEVRTGQISVVSHSLGAIHTVEAMKDDNTRNAVHHLILAAPAGYGGVGAAPQAVASVMTELRHRPTSDDVRHTTRDAIGYALKANRHLMQKIKQARQTLIANDTRYLMNRGLATGAMIYPGDRLINPTAMRRGLEQAGVEVIETVSPAELGHNAHLFAPDRAALAFAECIKQLDYLESLSA